VAGQAPGERAWPGARRGVALLPGLDVDQLAEAGPTAQLAGGHGSPGPLEQVEPFGARDPGGSAAGERGPVDAALRATRPDGVAAHHGQVVDVAVFHGLPDR